MSNNLGKQAENKAARYLIDRGYQIIARNQQIAGVEIDILASKENQIEIFEVKQRSSHFIADQSLSDHQLLRLKRAAKSLPRVGAIYLITVVGEEISLFEIFE